MTRAKPVLAGGAAAIIVAGASQLFPSFDTVTDVAKPTSAEFAMGERAFADLLASTHGDLGGLEHLGFVTGELDGVQNAVLIAESSQDCAGRGVYWLRDNAKSKLAITAPHRGSDRHTGQLTAALFEETKARGAAWNSVPRRPTAKCAKAIDLAHEKDHLFSAFSLAFAEVEPDGVMVQLHGFEGARRDSDIAQRAGMILSNGTQNPSTRLLNIADCLTLAFAPRAVLVYPGDTGELGALSNAQGQLLNAAAFDGFVHLEIAADLRADLVEDGALRAKFAACLVEGAQ